MSRNEIYIACSERTYVRLVRVLAHTLGHGPEQVEQRIEHHLRRLVTRLAGRPEVVRLLMTAGVPGARGGRDRSPPPGDPARPGAARRGTRAQDPRERR